MNNVEIAKQKLQESDWSVLSDVNTTLVNKQDFIDYRAFLRIIVVYNVESAIIPAEPVAVWSTPTQA
jgi:hypothetical protein